MPIHIIDDEITITDVLSDVLSLHSDQISCFHSAEEYLLHIGSDRYVEPRLIITDVRMGKMDGFELIKTVRANGLKAKTIVMSGFHNYINSAEQGFDGILSKPFDIDLLQSMVSQVLLDSNVPPPMISSHPLQHQTNKPGK